MVWLCGNLPLRDAVSSRKQKRVASMTVSCHGSAKTHAPMDTSHTNHIACATLNVDYFVTFRLRHARDSDADSS